MEFKEKEPSGLDRFDLLFVAFLVIALLAVYGRTLGYGFLWDDPTIYERSVGLEAGDLPDLIYLTDAMDDTHIIPYYRPVSMLLYWLEYQAWGLEPAGYRGALLFLHIVVAALFYFLLRRISFGRWASISAVALWALHPVQPEVVAFASAQNVIFSGLFLLLSLHVFLGLSGGGRKADGTAWNLPGDILLLTVGLLLFMASMLSKEQSVFLPVFFLLGLVVFGRNGKWSRSRGWALTAGSFLVFVLYFILRSKALGRLTETARASMPGDKQLSLMASAFIENMKLMLFPLKPSPFYELYPGGLFSVTFVSAVLLLIAIFWLIARRKTPTRPRLALLWLLCSLIPISNLVPFPSASIANRYLYFPLMGATMLIGIGIEKVITRWRAGGIALLLVLASVLGYISYDWAGVWQNNLILFERGLKDYPENTWLQSGLASSYFNEGEYRKALDHYSIYLDLRPGNVKTYDHIGVAYLELGDYEKAQKWLAKAIAHSPGRADSYYNLGILAKREEKMSRGIFLFKTALSIDPSMKTARNNLGVLLLEEERYMEAGQQFQILLEESGGGFKAARYNMGLALIGLEHYREAGLVYSDLLRDRPSDSDAWYQLGRVYEGLDIPESAKESYRQALKHKPGFEEAREALERLGGSPKEKAGTRKFRQLPRIP